MSNTNVLLVKQNYDKFYASIGFERSGLFELISKTYTVETVLYPGSSIHITPSFYFPHVVYVDKSDMAALFFYDLGQVIQFIQQKKKYKRSPYVQFLHQDFKSELNLRKASFDLVISLFSGAQLEHSLNYCKPGGLILSCNLFSDHETLSGSRKFTRDSIIVCENQKYVFTEKPESKKKESTLKKSNKTMQYVDCQIYTIYKNEKPKSKTQYNMKSEQT